MEEINMGNTESILYVQTNDHPERQYSPLILAQTALAMNIDAKIVYLGQGLRVLQPDTAKKIHLGNYPPLIDLIQETMKMGVQFYVCEASRQFVGMENVEIIPGLKVIGAATLNDLVLESTKSMWF
jgi:predicted peroxiredoxin